MTDLEQSRLGEFVELIMHGASLVGQGLAPEDNWAPVLFIESASGDNYIVGFDGDFMASPESKDQLYEAMCEQLRKYKAVRYAFLSSAWTVQASEDSAPLTVAPSQHPDRKEVLIIVAGDAEQETMHYADIIRDGEHAPTLGEWHASDALVGRRFAYLNEVLREIRA